MESNKQNADDWRNIECWVDDDFDANELIQDLKNNGLGNGTGQDDDDDWDDWSGDEEKDGRTVEGPQRTRGKGREFQSRGKTDVTDGNWRKSSKTEKIPRRRQSRGAEDRKAKEKKKEKERQKPVRGAEEVGRERPREHHRRGGRRHAKEEPDLFPLKGKDKKMDEMSSAFARLMPIEGWKPAGEEEEEEEESGAAEDGEEDYYDDDNAEEPPHTGGLPHVHSERQKLIHGELADGTPARSRRHRSRHRKRSSHNKSKSPEPASAGTRRPVRIHYTDGVGHPPSDRVTAAEAKDSRGPQANAGETKPKKKVVLESRWANADDQKTDTENANAMVSSRGQHPQKKITGQPEHEPHEPATASLDARNKQFTNEDTKASAETPKTAKPKPKLASIWA